MLDIFNKKRTGIFKDLGDHAGRDFGRAMAAAIREEEEMSQWGPESEEFNRFDEVRLGLTLLFDKYETMGLVKPEILPALDSDGHDEVQHTAIYVKVQPEEIEAWQFAYHARHLFGHYLAGLHKINDEYANLVADVIAAMLAHPEEKK